MFSGNPIQCIPIFFMTHRSFSVILSSHIGNLSQVRLNLHRSWPTDRCNWHRLPIDVFPIIFDARGLRPDMLHFPRFSVWIYVFILWRHSPSVNVITQTQGKRSMSGISPLASNIIGKTSIAPGCTKSKLAIFSIKDTVMNIPWSFVDSIAPHIWKLYNVYLTCIVDILGGPTGDTGFYDVP